MNEVEKVLNKIEEEPFGHFAIRGPSGSGKMTLLKLVDHHLRQRIPSEKSRSAENDNRFMVVTLEETYDSKNLIGCYVCNEEGHFEFKKGPLAVAAEKGLWLVLRNIEDTPSDLMSFMLPLVQDNILPVSSTLTIKPSLGFRIFALAKSEAGQQTAQEETIKPLMNMLTPVKVRSLMPHAQREDMVAILKQKYPSLFEPVLGAEEGIHELL